MISIFMLFSPAKITFTLLLLLILEIFIHLGFVSVISATFYLNLRNSVEILALFIGSLIFKNLLLIVTFLTSKPKVHVSPGVTNAVMKSASKKRLIEQWPTIIFVMLSQKL